jgi:hypothetical protein
MDKVERQYIFSTNFSGNSLQIQSPNIDHIRFIL